MNGIQFQQCQIVAAGPKDTVKHDVVVSRHDHATATTNRVPSAGAVNLHTDSLWYQL